LHPGLGHAPAGLPIARAQQTPIGAIEQAVVRTEVELWVIEQQPNRDAAQLARRACTQGLIERVVDPAVPTLDLAGESELVVLIGQSLAVLLDDPANRNAPDDGCVRVSPLSMMGALC
jgi:hypothetical protein